MKHLAGQVRIKLNSQSINSISRVLQKLLKCFNDTLVLTFFIPSFSILPDIFVFNFKKALLILSAGKSAISPFLFKNRSSPQYCHKIPDVLEYLSLYSIKSYTDIIMSMYIALSICVLFISLMQSVNGV